MDDMHFLLLKTEESPCLLTKGPNIRISCANTSCVITSAVQSNLVFIDHSLYRALQHSPLIRACQSEGKGRQKQDLRRRQLFVVMKITLLEQKH